MRVKWHESFHFFAPLNRAGLLRVHVAVKVYFSKTDSGFGGAAGDSR